MKPVFLSALALATALVAPVEGAFAQKSARHELLMRKAAPKPSNSPLSLRSWEPAARAWGSFIVAIATPAKNDPESLPNHRCTGVLVSRQHVLASGYCVGDARDEAAVVQPDTLEVYLGGKVDPGSRPTRVTALFRHPEYDPLSFRGDVVILKLSQPVAGPVEPIGLSSAPEASLRQSTSAGWMQDDTGDRQIIMRMTVPHVAKGRCEAIMREERIANAQHTYADIISSLNVPPELALTTWKSLTKAMPVILSNEMICAGPEDGVPCGIDAGSVLLSAPQGGAPELIGVFTHLTACEAPGVPAVYTRIAPYADWIRETIKK